MVDNFTFWHMLSLSLGAMSRFHMVWCPLKCTCMSNLLQVFLNFLLSPLKYGTTMQMVLFVGFHVVGVSVWTFGGCM